MFVLNASIKWLGYMCYLAIYRITYRSSHRLVFPSPFSFCLSLDVVYKSERDFFTNVFFYLIYFDNDLKKLQMKIRFSCDFLFFFKYPLNLWKTFHYKPSETEGQLFFSFY